MTTFTTATCSSAPVDTCSSTGAMPASPTRSTPSSSRFGAGLRVRPATGRRRAQPAPRCVPGALDAPPVQGRRHRRRRAGPQDRHGSAGARLAASGAHHAGPRACRVWRLSAVTDAALPARRALRHLGRRVVLNRLRRGVPHLCSCRGDRSNAADGRVLRPRQDDHREVEHAAFSRPFYAGGLINRRAGAAQRVRPVRLPAGWCRPRPDGADARLPVRSWCPAGTSQTVTAIVAETLHHSSTRSSTTRPCA